MSSNEQSVGSIRMIFSDFWLVIDSFKLTHHQTEARKDQLDGSIKNDCLFEDMALLEGKKTNVLNILFMVSICNTLLWSI